MKRFYFLKDLAAYLGVSKTVLERWKKLGLLVPSAMVERFVLYSEEEANLAETLVQNPKYYVNRGIRSQFTFCDIPSFCEACGKHLTAQTTIIPGREINILERQIFCKHCRLKERV